MRIVESFMFYPEVDDPVEYCLEEFIELLLSYNLPHLYVNYYETEELLETVKGIIYSLGLELKLVLDGSPIRTYSFYVV